jgi:hypothetical protein
MQGEDPRGGESLSHQVEHRRPVHDRPLVKEPDSAHTRQPGKLTEMDCSRPLVDGGHVQAGSERLAYVGRRRLAGQVQHAHFK